MLKSLTIAIAGGCLLLLGCSQTTTYDNHTATSGKHAAYHLSSEITDKLCTIDTDIEYDGPVAADLWDRIRAGYALPQAQAANNRVQHYIDWYQSKPGFIKRVTERGTPYLHFIVTELEKRDMPLEIAFLPVIESAFDPFAHSNGNASGIWQFIPNTGLHFGLKQNWWYDGRRDPIASTEAALDYLAKLHQRMDNDWLLAIAAYNSGEGNVRRAMEKNQKLGRSQDYWSLDLPPQTEKYIPKLIALSKIFGKPSLYGLDLTPIPNQPYFAVVETTTQLDLAQAAKMTGISLADLYRLNAGFNRWATDPQGPHRLLVPISKASELKNNLARLPLDERVVWERYTVKSGDSLLVIAKHFRTTVEVLKQQNKISGNMIRSGQSLMIPVSSKPPSQYALASTPLNKQTRVRSGTPQKVAYKVAKGDSLWSIAKRFGVDVAQLARWNGISTNTALQLNHKLYIWTQNPNASTLAGNDLRKVAYQVKQGDSLERIADRFNLSITDIKRWNSSVSNRVRPGQSLTLFVNMTRFAL